MKRRIYGGIDWSETGAVAETRGHAQYREHTRSLVFRQDLGKRMSIFPRMNRTWRMRGKHTEEA